VHANSRPSHLGIQLIAGIHILPSYVQPAGDLIREEKKHILDLESAFILIDRERNSAHFAIRIIIILRGR
jgi:hypothetical protein